MISSTISQPGPTTHLNMEQVALLPKALVSHDCSLKDTCIPSPSDEEYYEVKHANTGRLMKSAVPFMQRLLNLQENNQQKKKAINEHNIERKKRRPG